LWTANKVTNHENLSKDSDALVVLWNEKHPDELVTS